MEGSTDRQAEYLIARNQVPRGQITTRLFILLIFLVIAYAAIWYFWPTSTLANLPYCIYPKDSHNQSTDMISGIFASGTRAIGFEGDYVREVFRFYPDGFVIHHTEYHNHWDRIDLEAYGGWRGILNWFNRQDYEHSPFADKGSYSLAGNQIKIETGSSAINQPMTWAGTFAGDSMKLTWVDDVLDESVTKTFSRIIIEECPFGSK